MMLIVPELASNKNLLPRNATLLYGFANSRLSAIAMEVSLIVCIELSRERVTILLYQYGDNLREERQGLLLLGPPRLARFRDQWQESERRWKE